MIMKHQNTKTNQHNNYNHNTTQHKRTIQFFTYPAAPLVEPFSSQASITISEDKGQIRDFANRNAQRERERERVTDCCDRGVDVEARAAFFLPLNLNSEENEGSVLRSEKTKEKC